MNNPRDLNSHGNRLHQRVRGRIASLPEGKVLERIEELLHTLKDPSDIPVDVWRFRDSAYAKAVLDASKTIDAVGEVSKLVLTFSSVRDLVSLHADQIVAWIRHFYWSQVRSFSDPIYKDEDGRQSLIKGLSRALNAIKALQPFDSSFSQLHPEIQSSLDIISGLWLEEDVQNYNPSASELLWHILPAAEVQMKDALVISANGDADRVANVAILKLRLEMKKASPKSAHLMLHFVNAVMLAHGDHPVSSSLHDHQIFSTFAKCIRLLTRLPDGNYPSLTIACARYFMVLEPLILRDARNGTLALKQNIRFGLLGSIAHLRISYTGNTANQAIMPLIRNTLLFISHGLKSLAVCSETLKALKELPLHAFQADANIYPEWDVWNQLMVSIMAHSFFMKHCMLILVDEKETRDLCSNVRFSLLGYNMHNQIYLACSTVPSAVFEKLFMEMCRVFGHKVLLRRMPNGRLEEWTQRSVCVLSGEK